MSRGTQPGAGQFSNSTQLLVGASDLKGFKRTLLIAGPIILLGTAVRWYQEKNQIPESERLRIEDLRLKREQEEKRQQLFASNPNAKAVIEEAQRRSKDV